MTDFRAGINAQGFPLGDVSRLITAADRLVRAVHDVADVVPGGGQRLRDLCAVVDDAVAALTDQTGGDRG